MKRLILLLLVAGLALPYANAQEKLSYKSKTTPKKLIIIGDDTELKITGYSGTEVVIETSDYDGPPERAKGLRPLYSGGVDNTGLGLDVKESGGEMTVNVVNNESVTYEIKVPQSINISIEETGWEGNDFEITNISGEIELQCKGSDIMLKDVTGPVVASTTSGDITIVFSKVNQSQPISISNVSGFIDVTLPASTKANLVLSSVSGEIYTDLDLKVDQKDGMRRHGGSKIESKLNGGGVEINLRAISDDIYLRKSK